MSKITCKLFVIRHTQMKMEKLHAKKNKQNSVKIENPSLERMNEKNVSGKMRRKKIIKKLKSDCKKLI